MYYWQLSMASFRFCETYLLHIKPFVVNKSAISPFLGGVMELLAVWRHKKPKTKNETPCAGTRHSLCPAIQLPQCRLPLYCRCLPHLPLMFTCPNQKLRGARRHPGGLGTEQTLSPLVRVLVSFEHEAGLFHTRHQNPYTVGT